MRWFHPLICTNITRMIQIISVLNGMEVFWGLFSFKNKNWKSICLLWNYYLCFYFIFTAVPSQELVERIRDLYHKRVPDVRFLIPVLNGLSKVDFIMYLLINYSYMIFLHVMLPLYFCRILNYRCEVTLLYIYSFQALKIINKLPK